MRISDWSSDVCSSYLALLLGIRVQLALAQLGGDLCDRLVLQPLVELLAERLHERHALDHHVEHLSLTAGLAHQVVDRDRFAIAAQHPARSLRSEKHTSELRSLMIHSYAVLCHQQKKRTW